MRDVAYLKVLVQVLVQLQDGGHVAAPVAVVGCRPHRHQAVRGLRTRATAAFSGEHGFVSLHDELVGPGDEVQVVDLVELRHHVPAKEIPRAPGRQTPALDVLGVGPHEVAHGAIVRHLLLPVDHPNLHIEEKNCHQTHECMHASVSESRGSGIGQRCVCVCTWSRVLIAGDKPPCTQNILSSIIADKLK